MLSTGSSQLPAISIIVPVRNECRFISDTLRQLLDQEYPADRFEILVIDGMSEDNTVEIATRLATGGHVRVLENPSKLSSAARNIGVRESRGNWVLIVDGHVSIPNRFLLQASAEIIARTGARVLGRPQRLRAQPLTEKQEAIAAFRESLLGHSPNSFIFSGFEGWVDPGSVAVMYEKSLFDEHGGFDESLDAAEDYEFNSRLSRGGVRCYLSPRIEVLYFPRDSFLGLYRQMRRYGFGQARLAARDTRARAKGGWLPALFVLGAVALLAGSLFKTAIAAAAALLCLLYATVVYLANRRYCGSNLRRMALVVGAALAVHFGLGVGWWHGVLQGK